MPRKYIIRHIKSATTQRVSVAILLRFGRVKLVCHLIKSTATTTLATARQIISMFHKDSTQYYRLRLSSVLN